jgi:hypothetical protein
MAKLEYQIEVKVYFGFMRWRVVASYLILKLRLYKIFPSLKRFSFASLRMNEEECLKIYIEEVIP